MSKNHSDTLNKEKALIFRIVHINNLPWIVQNGLHCGNSSVLSSNWEHIGNPELIAKRGAHEVSVGPKGVLNDYVPFYFTPFSPMLLNIKTGRGGVEKRANEDIVILVSSIPKLIELNQRFVFTDAHAYYSWAKFYSDPKDLEKIDWDILQKRDFERDPDDPGKFERYQAEALIYQHCPVKALLGMICHNEIVETSIKGMLNDSGLDLPIYTRPRWYF